ncbi:MAG: hypothetical protein KJ850_01845 [Gammaproteobacteria bacterium]|nr:hypothetical protein [Gammaproteobacteria bacterium]MBU1623764.1 hypothetical protein [Gammaproteobacteria bacterium]
MKKQRWISSGDSTAITPHEKHDITDHGTVIAEYRQTQSDCSNLSACSTLNLLV